MEKMLSQLEYHEGNFKEAIDSAYRAITLINREFLVSVQCIDALSIFTDVLRRIATRTMAPPDILSAVLLIEQHLNKPNAEPVVQPIKLCETYFGISFLFFHFAQN